MSLIRMCRWIERGVWSFKGIRRSMALYYRDKKVPLKGFKAVM